MPKYSKTAMDNYRRAVMHRVRMWDALRAVETEIEKELSGENVPDLAAAVDDPADAMKLTDADICEAIDADLTGS